MTRAIQDLLKEHAMHTLFGESPVDECADTSRFLDHVGCVLVGSLLSWLPMGLGIKLRGVSAGYVASATINDVLAGRLDTWRFSPEAAVLTMRLATFFRYCNRSYVAHSLERAVADAERLV